MSETHNERRDWEVRDLARDRTPMEQAMGNALPADFGPMTEREARALVQLRPKAYWARKIQPLPSGGSLNVVQPEPRNSEPVQDDPQ